VHLKLSQIQGQSQYLAQQARQLRLQWNIDSGAIIHSTKPRWGPFIIRFQSLVRRATWWFLEPILQQIRSFQMNAAHVLDGLAQQQEALATLLTATALADDRAEATIAHGTQSKPLERETDEAEQ